MVYCGKASQGCQSCRTRRIKCDKVRPECTQCARVGRKCPGYRDQLSLMFRDESSKVIQKAHASWGVDKAATVGSPGQQSSYASSSSSSASSWGSSSPSSTTSSEGQSPPYRRSSAGSVVPGGTLHVITPKMYRKVEPTIEQRGLQFFLDRYLLGQPDAPANNEQLAAYSSGPAAMQNVMIAVGLAGLSNTVGDRAMNMLSRQKYTQALTQVQGLIAAKPTGSATVIPPLRIVVTLALFEVVQGSGNKLSTGTANVHIFGAIALLRSAMPIRSAPAGGVRGILQLMFSLVSRAARPDPGARAVTSGPETDPFQFIPSQLTEMPLPPVFFEALNTCKQALPPTEQCCCDIAMTIARYLRLLPTISNLQLSDGDQTTEGIFQQVLELDETLARLEDDLQKAFPFELEFGNYPPAAVFQGKYHNYSEIWGARLWNHLRWARILIVQKLLELSDEFPVCGAQYMHPAQREYCMATIRRMAEDIIVSTPSHWHHPILDQGQAKKVAAAGKGGSGGVGLPTLLWHLKIAGCAPGVPDEHWQWAHDLIEVVWKNMGMQHAFALSEVMRGHKAGLEKEAIERILKIEDRDW